MKEMLSNLFNGLGEDLKKQVQEAGNTAKEIFSGLISGFRESLGVLGNPETAGKGMEGLGKANPQDALKAMGKQK
jgi:hypothetical protein